LIQRLEAANIERTGRALAAERGLSWRPVIPGSHVIGQLVGSTQLSSGRFAMIESFSGDGGLGFSLVPWQPVLDKRIGSTSPASPCRAAELTGHSHGREGWGCERRASLACLKASRPGQRHPVKAGAFRTTASRLAALTGCRRPSRGLPSR